MRKHWLFATTAALGMCVGAHPAVAHADAGSGQDSASSQPTHWYSPARYKKYNPVNLFHRDRNASQQLFDNPEEAKKLTLELQSLLPLHADLMDLCSEFKTLEDCVATIHASHSVSVRFECLKWYVAAAKPDSGAASCSDPESKRPQTLERAIRELKPGADAKEEAKTALRKARENITDAKS